MPYDPNKHHRRSTRLKGYDYALPGAYFVTICTRDRAFFFGDVVDGVMRHSPIGATAHAYWAEIPDHFREVVVDAFVVMPNHVHGIIGITDRVPANRHHDAEHHGDGRRDVQLNVPTGSLHHPPPNPPNVPTGSLHHPPPNPPNVPTGSLHHPPPNPSTTPAGRYFSDLSPGHGTLSVIARTYKAAVTRWCRENGYPAFGWQPRFHDHIIRNGKALARIRRYIAENPLRWHDDREYPNGPPSCR